MSPSTPRQPRATSADARAPENVAFDAGFSERLNGNGRARRGPRARAIPKEGPLTPEQAERALIASLRAGEPWYGSLLGVIARWVEPEETVDGERYAYLIGGEAFDWLLLAQRLLDATGELVPEEEREALLRFGVTPDGEDEEAFARGIGPAKHRAHLNFQYGVVVEEALLLAAEQEIRKAGRLSYAADRDADLDAYSRVYGRPLEELRTLCRHDSGLELGDSVSLAELREFTYWCSKYRVQSGEPERVASDTRKALALLSEMEGRRGGPASRDAGTGRAGRLIEDAGTDPASEPPRRPGGNGRRAPRPDRRRGAAPPPRRGR